MIAERFMDELATVQMDGRTVGDEGMERRFDRLAWVPVPLLLTGILVLSAADVRGSYESLYLLLALNVLFSALVCGFVAYLIARSFLVRGTPGLLLLGCGVILWGLAGVVAIAVARGDINSGITIYNSCVWLSALCHLAGVLLLRYPRQTLSPKALWLPAGYVLAIGAVALIALAGAAGWLPLFFVQGQGGTPLRQIVLGSAIVMFAFTAFLLGARSRRPPSAFAYWYALGLSLIGLGLLAVMPQSHMGGIVGWVGRGSQALGGSYMLVAALASVRESNAWGMSLEAALRGNEDRLCLALEAAQMATWDWDIASGNIVWNDEYYRILGYEPGSVTPGYQAWVARVHPDDLARTEARLHESKERSGGYTAEYRILWPDGTVRWVEARGRFESGAMGKAACSHGVLIDVTDRRRAEEALRIKDSAIASSLNAIAIADLQGRLTYINPAFIRLWGYEDEHEVLEKSVLEFWQEPQRAMDVVQAIRKGGGWVGELVAVRKDGSPLNLHLSASTVRNDEGAPVCMMASFVDVTERKQAEEELRQAMGAAQQRCAETSALMQGTRAVLECQDFAATARAVFDACREVLGAPAGYVALLNPQGTNNDVLFLEPGGLSCTVAPSLPMPLRGFRAEAHRLGRVIYDNDFANSRWARLLPPGHVRLENVLFAPMEVEGRSLGLLALGNKAGGFTEHDMTLAATFGELIAIALRNSRVLDSLRELNATLEEKVAERTAELQRRTKQLQQLAMQLTQAEDRERSRIAALLHEDLQQQIAGAKFHLSMLKHLIRDTPRQLAVIARTDEMLGEAIEKSRSLAHELSPAVLHQNDLGEALHWLSDRMGTKHGLAVRIEAPVEERLHSDALTIFLFRSAQEMLLNVTQHAGVKQATVRMRRRGRHVGLSVSDRGRGFDPAELHETPGFGLLSIRERSEMLGGRTSIRSRKGAGSRLHIIVPDNGEVRNGQKCETVDA